MGTSPMLPSPWVVVLVLAGGAPCRAGECRGKVCLEGNYSRWQHQQGERPFKVEIEIRLFDIVKVDSERNQLQLSLGLKLYWMDSRVSCRDLRPFCLVLDRETMERVWRPVLYIQDLVSFTVKATHSNIEDLGIEVTTNGTMLFHYSEALVTLACPMDFTWYPFDRQICRLNLFELNIEPTEDFLLTIHRSGRGPGRGGQEGKEPPGPG